MTDIDSVAHIRHLPIVEQFKYCQARYVWTRRNNFVPDKNGVNTDLTWLEWWQSKYKEDYYQYVEQQKKLYGNKA